MFFKPEYILILGGTIVVDYIAGIKIANAGTQSRKKFYLILSLVANIGVLAVFKYYNFINDNITGIASLFGFNNNIPALTIILPIGLSFHTFQAMSYTIEVYRGHQEPEKHFGIYALYVMFYPQLVAGPIERPQNMLHQFWERHTWDHDRFMSGLRLMGWGLFKKVVVADQLSIVVDALYSGTYGYSTVWSFLGTMFFSYQIYCDFSGYSDIAIGSARTMGFTLMTNFDRPYSAKTVTEFWRRWHISLSTWFRDYVYIPLGGNRVSKGRRYVNLMIVFVLSGLWHGAGWPFLIWGALHGLAIVYEGITKDWRAKTIARLPKWFLNPFSTLLVFLFVQFVWIFFRANTFEKAFAVIKGFFNYTDFFALFSSMTAAIKYSIVVGLFSLANFLLIERLMKNDKLQIRFKESLTFRTFVFAYFILLFIFFGSFKNAQSFIYFQF